MTHDATTAMIAGLVPEGDLSGSKVLSKLIVGGYSALNRLFDDVRDELKTMISSRLDRQLAARVDASDIVQETFIRAVSSLPSYLESPNVHPVIWLRLIGKHLVVETHRCHFRAKRNPSVEVAYEDNGNDCFVNQIADSMTSVHSVLAKEELVSKVRALMHELATQDREMLEMRHTEGLSIMRIAELLEIPLETAKKRYYRALERFRIVAAEALPDDR